MNRTPAGVPTGGQFSESARSEPDVDLYVPSREDIAAGLDASLDRTRLAGHAARKAQAELMDAQSDIARERELAGELAGAYLAMHVRDHAPDAHSVELSRGSDDGEGYTFESIKGSDGKTLPNFPGLDIEEELRLLPQDTEDVEWMDETYSQYEWPEYSTIVVNLDAARRAGEQALAARDD